MARPDINPLPAAIARRGWLVVDGAMGTELAARGHDVRDALWSARLLLDDPGAIRAVHEAYVAAGADVLITASYQASVAGLARRGIGESEALRVIRGSVALAREAAVAAGRPDVLVAASVGPYGAARADGSEFTGAYDLDERGLAAWHRARFQALAASGADLLACETLPSLVEAQALLRLLDEAPAGTWAWFSFSCRDDEHLSDGTPIADCAALLDRHARVAAVGVNCTPPRHCTSLVRRLRATTGLPIVVYPNSGETWDAATRTWHGDADPVDFAALARQWRDAGASLIGGCCRTGPRHVRSLAEVRSLAP